MSFTSPRSLSYSALLILFFSSLLFNCKTKNEPPTGFIDPAFGEYISTYTAGVISSNSPIRIIFAKEAIDSASIGQETSVKLFDFNPSISGKTKWLDRRTLEFKPDGRMPSGQVYQVEFNLSKLFEVPKELTSFNYSFQIIPQGFELSINNVKPYVKTELKRQRIEGSLATADFAEAQSIEKMMEATQETI